MKIETLTEQKLDGVTVVQFQTDTRDSLAYRTSAAAIRDRLIEVRELSQQGSVNNLIVDNPSEHFVFFMDGDVLVGAKQNRVLNVSILLAPKTRTTVSVVGLGRVPCGRWRSLRDIGGCGGHVGKEFSNLFAVFSGLTGAQALFVKLKPEALDPSRELHRRLYGLKCGESVGCIQKALEKVQAGCAGEKRRRCGVLVIGGRALAGSVFL
jgi:hypothetical protein